MFPEIMLPDTVSRYIITLRSPTEALMIWWGLDTTFIKLEGEDGIEVNRGIYCEFWTNPCLLNWEPCNFWSHPVSGVLHSQFFLAYAVFYFLHFVANLGLPPTQSVLHFCRFPKPTLPKFNNTFCAFPLLRNNGYNPSWSKTRSGPLQTSAPKANTPHPREQMSGLPDIA